MLCHWSRKLAAVAKVHLVCDAQVDGVQVQVALQWCSDAFSDTLLGFVNSIKTIDGGTHMDGFKAALTRMVNSLGRKSKALKEGDPNLSGDHIREGLGAIVSVKVCHCHADLPVTVMTDLPSNAPQLSYLPWCGKPGSWFHMMVAARVSIHAHRSKHFYHLSQKAYLAGTLCL